jgi:hypothetical protein
LFNYEQLPVQINGKKKFNIILSKNLSSNEVVVKVQESSKLKSFSGPMTGLTHGYTERIIVVPHRLINVIWAIRKWNI